jgi:hypothetical protein
MKRADITPQEREGESMDIRPTLAVPTFAIPAVTCAIVGMKNK